MRIIRKKKSNNIVFFVFLYIFCVIIFLLIFTSFSLGYSDMMIKKNISQKKTIKIPTLTQDKSVISNIFKIEESKKIKIPIIMYHYVENVPDEDKPKKSLATRPSIFEGQLSSLKNDGYETIFVKDIPQIMKDKSYANKKIVALTFDDGYEDFYNIVLPLLKKYNSRGTVYVINNFIGRDTFMSSWQLKQVAKSDLVEIGSHTLDHVFLSTLNEKSARYQIAESKKGLEKLLNKEVLSFAYPSGSYNEKTPIFVHEAGFVSAVTTDKGILQENEDVFLLWRVRGSLFSSYSISTELDNMKK